MDTKPYMEFSLDDMDETLLPELRKLAKGKFDRDACMSAANELKYNREFKRIMAEQMENPHEDFIRFFLAQTYDGKITQNIRERFTPILVAALEQFINDRINIRLKNAMTQQKTEVSEAPAEELPEAKPEESRIITTEEEKEAYYLIKSLMVGTIDPSRGAMRDAINYCSILLDDNRLKPICRLYFNGKQWRIGMFDGENKDAKEDIEKLDDIISFTDRLRATVLKYDQK